ncbi:hypothetical protein ACT4S2_17005 [Kocuria turfanensis]|uniref:hypothetical protein n=1 Tax=Kocuria turfanensis TaxID=388357 RepID=UPI00403695E2
MATPRGADDEALVHEQARRLRVTMLAAGIDRPQLWLYYFSIGGDVSEFELDAYLHHSLALPRLQRDMLAQAANEILIDLAPPKAPYAADLTGGPTVSTGRSAADDGNAPLLDRDAKDRNDPRI